MTKNEAIALINTMKNQEKAALLNEINYAMNVRVAQQHTHGMFLLNAVLDIVEKIGEPEHEEE